MHVCVYVCVGVCAHILFATPWTVALQAPLSMGFSRQEHWSGLPFLPPRDLPDPGIKPPFSASPALAGGFLPLSSIIYLSIHFLKNILAASKTYVLCVLGELTL